MTTKLDDIRAARKFFGRDDLTHADSQRAADMLDESIKTTGLDSPRSRLLSAAVRGAYAVAMGDPIAQVTTTCTDCGKTGRDAHAQNVILDADLVTDRWMPGPKRALCTDCISAWNETPEGQRAHRYI